MRIEMLSAAEKKKIIDRLEKQHGIRKINHLLFRVGREKIRGYTGSLSKDEIKKLNSLVRIENIGLYLMKDENNEIRLSIDGCHAFSDQIKNNIIEIDNKQKDKWLRGENLDTEEKDGIYVVVWNGLFLGTTKIVNKRMLNYVPKERRIRN